VQIFSQAFFNPQIGKWNHPPAGFWDGSMVPFLNGRPMCEPLLVQLCLYAPLRNAADGIKIAISQVAPVKAAPCSP
jgi:hypothetical protein